MSSRVLSKVVAAAICLAGCRQTIQLAAPNQGGEIPVRQMAWTRHFLLGFVGREVVDMREYCPGYVVQRVELDSTLPTVVVTAATLGIYTPRRLVVTCQKKGEK